MKLLNKGLITAVLWLCNVLVSHTVAAQATSDSVALPNSAKVKADLIYFDAVKSRLKGDDRQAEELLLQFLKLQPEASGAYFDLARLNLRQNKTDKAIEYIKKAIALEDVNPWYKSQYAEILVSQNKFEDAAGIYSSIAKNEKYNEDYLLKAAMLYQHSGKLKEAMASLDKLIEKDGNDEAILMQQQQLYLKMNDVDGAVKIIQKLIDQNPQEGRFYTVLADIYNNNKRPEKAEEVFLRMEKQFPEDPNVQVSLAEYYKKKKNETKYREYVEKAITNKALDAETQLSLLVAYLQEDGMEVTKKNEGIRLAEKIVAQHNDNPQVIAVYGDVLALSGEKYKAVQQYKLSLAIDPGQYKVWQNLLYGYADRVDADSLILYSEKALKLFPNQALLHYLNGVGHLNKKEYNTAVKSINRAIDMQPEDNKQLLADMYSTLGDVYQSIKEYTQSDTSYERALRLDPDNASVMNNYSYYLAVRGVRLVDAEKMSKRSLEIRKDEPTFMDTYGWVLYKMKQYEKAKDFIQMAVDANPTNADATLLEHLGDVLFKLNDVDRAVEYWKKSKERGSDNTLIDKKINERKLYE